MPEGQPNQPTPAVGGHRYARILDAIAEGCQIISPEWRYVYVNEAAAAQGNRTRNELIGARITDLYPGIENDRVFDELRRCMEHREPRSIEHEFTYPDGSKRWFDLHIQPDPEGILVTSIDISERKQSMEELARIFTMSMDMLCIADIHTSTFTKVNPAFSEVLGFSEEELLGKPFLDFIHPEDVDATRSVVEESLQAGKKVINFENRYRCKDGSYRWLSWVSHPNIEEGVTFSVARDVTERKHQEDALRLSKALLDATGRMAKVGGWELDPKTEEVNWTEETYRIHEVPLDAKPSLEDAIHFFHPDDQKRLSEAIERALEHGEPYDLETRFITAKGNHLWTRTLCRPQVENGEVVKLFGTFQDITDRKEIELALVKKEAMLANLASQVPGMLYQFMMAPDGTFSVPYSSGGVVDIFGCSPEDVRDTFEPIFDAIHPEDRDLILETIAESAETLSQWKCEYRVQLPDEPIKWVYGNSVPEKKSDGSILWFGYNVDITDRKLAEEEHAKLEANLRQSQKMESVGRLAGGVAHDFNNMLGVILGNAEIALRQLDPSQQLYADLVEIQEAGERSADLTRQLLAFARKQTISPEVLDLNDTVDGMIRMLQRLIGEDINLIWLPGTDVWPVKMDPGQIDQMLANLCLNARDAIAEPGKITIETGNAVLDESHCADHPGSSPGEYAFLAVSDDGCGMEADAFETIFEPFYTTKALGSGTGLGLAMVYGIVKQNDGFITVDSEPGQGSTFSIYLPPHWPREDLLPKEVKTAVTEGGQETILLVEDEPAILRMAEKMLEGLGYQVLVAGTPGDAIRTARGFQGQIHLLITDVVMPEMNGWDLSRDLLAIQPELKCLFMSGYTADVIARHGVLEEGVNFIHKPFSGAQLGAKVREVLDGLL